MNRATLEWYELLARSLTWLAWIVLLLAAVAAVVIAGSDSAAPIFGDIERQGRGVAALASLGGGITAAGLLAASGAILRVLVSDRLDRLGPAPEEKRGSEQEQLPFDVEASGGRQARREGR
jgi:hypothetical protein